MHLDPRAPAPRPARRRPARRAWISGLALLAAGCAEHVRVPAQAPAADPSSAWARVLEGAITPEGLDYAAIDEERVVLHQYLAWVGAHGPGLDELREADEDKRIAWMANAYNAIVINDVLQLQIKDSVQEVGGGVWGLQPGSYFFAGRKHRVDGDWQTLFMLEQQDIIGRYQEPLVHLALNCASKGCPPLRYWRPRGLTGQLRRALRGWLEGGAMRETDAGYAVSELLFWYEDDFVAGTGAESLCAYLADFTEGEAQQWMRRHRRRCTLERIPYDWSLNAAPPGSAAGQAPLPEPAPLDAEEIVEDDDEDGQL